MIEFLSFKCDFCDFIRLNKKYVKSHEKRCYYNPDNKSCVTCKHFDKVDREYDCYLGDGAVDQTVSKDFYCNSAECFLEKRKNNCILYERKVI